MSTPHFCLLYRKAPCGLSCRGLQPANDGLARQRRSGFSLVELLAVIAIISILTGVSTLSLKGLSGGSQLFTGGSQVANLLESARELAIVKKTPVAVALLAVGNNAGGRILTALELLPDSNQWARASKWESLPTGVLVDGTTPGVSDTFLPNNAPTISPALPNLVYGGTTYAPQNASGYGYIVFLPNGSLYQSGAQPGVFRLVEGVSTSAGTKFTGPKDSANNPANYFQIVINESTGRIKTARP